MRIIKAIRTAILKLQAWRVERRIRAVTCRCSELLKRDFFLCPVDRRETISELTHLQGTALPRLSLQLADIRLALREGQPPIGPLLGQVRTLPVRCNQIGIEEAVRRIEAARQPVIPMPTPARGRG